MNEWIVDGAIERAGNIGVLFNILAEILTEEEKRPCMAIVDEVMSYIRFKLRSDDPVYRRSGFRYLVAAISVEYLGARRIVDEIFPSIYSDRWAADESAYFRNITLAINSLADWKTPTLNTDVARAEARFGQYKDVVLDQYRTFRPNS